MSEGRGLGFGLIVLGGVLGGIMLVYLIANFALGALDPGGFVLGLLLASVLGLVPGGLGVWVLFRSKEEATAEADFASRRTLLEVDRLLRHDLGRDLEQIAERLADRAPMLAQRARDLSQDIRSPGYDQPGWYEAVELTAADRDVLERYEALATDAVRRLEDAADGLELRQETALDQASHALTEADRAWRQRAELLRGRRRAPVGGGELLGAEAGGSRADLTTIAPGDAITHDERDYLVETTVTYFQDGRTFWLHRLVAEQEERWLLVGPGALELAWLTTTTVPHGLTEVGSTDDRYRLQEREHVLAEVSTRSADRSETVRGDSETVQRWRYRDDEGRIVIVERWPDGPHAYAGEIIRASDLERWPGGYEQGRGSARSV